MELMTFALTAIWLWLFALGRVKISCACIKAWPLIGIWSLWLLYSLGHCIPLPPAVVTLLSPHTAAIHLHTGIVAPSQWIPLSLDPYASKVEWMKSLTYILIFILCLLLVESRKRLDILVWVMVCSATFQAVIGAILLFSRMDHTFYIHNPNALGWASGSFINRNHYANFLVMNLSLGIGLFISRLDFSQESHSRQGRWLSIIGVLLSFKAPLRIFLVIMVIGLILSHSRMGNTSFLASLTLAGGISLLSFRHAGQNNRPLILFLSSILIMDVLLLGSWFGVDKVVDRLRTTDLATEGRIHTGKHTLKMIEDFPLTGIGP
ncbi:MAG TPA: O-antigen ligase family protein, partial [Magnetococcales bacterium]|nr:O-antigen ligase family protein [Magnetococcales bacterium]